MAAQRAVRKLLLAVVALYLLFLISVWHVVNRSSARSIAYAFAAWFVSAPQPAARRLEAGDGGGCEPNTPFCERPLNQVMDMLLQPRAGEPLRAAQPVHIRA